MINLEKYSWSGSWVARKLTRKHTRGRFSSDDELTEGRENGPGGGGRLLDKTVEVCVARTANSSLKKSGWKINMGRGKNLKKS